MKVFLIQPMGDRSDEEILRERNKIVSRIVSQGHEVIDSFITEYPTHDVQNYSVYFLGESIKMMSEADAVFAMKGWSEARGCNIEMTIAETYDIPECDFVEGSLVFV